MAPLVSLLPPTSPDILLDEARPYFLWWTELTVRGLRERLHDPDPAVRHYWLGALLREANTRDVWYFVEPDDIRGAWVGLQRFLGRSRARWAFLLGLPRDPWPALQTGSTAEARSRNA
jgi:hypothetical protein